MKEEGGKLTYLQPLMKRSPNPAAAKLHVAGLEHGKSCVVAVSPVCEIDILKGNYRCQKKGTS
jgi:endonuclease III